MHRTAQPGDRRAGGYSEKNNDIRTRLGLLSVLWSREAASSRGRAGLGSQLGPSGPSDEKAKTRTAVCAFPTLARADPMASPRPQRSTSDTSIFAVKMLHIPPRAGPLHSSTRRSLALHPGFVSAHKEPSLLPSLAFLAPQFLLFSPRTGTCSSAPLPVGCTAPLACSQITSAGCAFPSSCWRTGGLVGPQILPWLLPRDGRRSEGLEELGSSWVGKGREALAIALACPPGEKHLIKSRCSIQGCYSFPILLACLILLNLL